MFTEEKRQTVITGTARKDDSTYKVEYRTENGELTRLSLQVTNTTSGTDEVPGIDEHVGFITRELGRTNISLSDTVDPAPHVAVFAEILDEVRTAVALKKSK